MRSSLTHTSSLSPAYPFLPCFPLRSGTYQAGFLSILFSIGSKPLQIWDKKVKNGHIKRITDPDIQSSVLEICGTNVSTTYVTCPAEPKSVLGIKLPYIVFIVKNLKKYFTFEVTVLDDKNVHRRFRASNYQVRLWPAFFFGRGARAPPPRGLSAPIACLHFPSHTHARTLT
jgi:hypothetical protein